MRKIISSLVLALFVSFTLIPIEASIAAEASSVAGFEIIAPTTAKANEAIDITVRAIDRDKKTVTKYAGSIIFISDTFGDVVPSPGKAIAFTQEDAGQKKFSKGVIFRSAGKQKIYVADVDNSSDIVWEVTVTVEPADPGTGPSPTETVTVVTPVQGSKITENMVVVSWKTKKNSKVSILLNGQDKGTAISDDTWLFTKTLSDISQEKNILQVQLLDGTNNILAKSPDIVFDKVVETQGFYNIIITPGTTVEASSQINILVEGDVGMTWVSVTIDGSVITLTEAESGKYSASIPAPAVAGEYPVDVSMKSSAGQSIEKKAVTKLAITPKAIVLPTFSNLKAVTEWKRVTFSFSVNNAPAELDKFKIAYGESADSLSKETITYSSGKIQWTGGVYSWYIDNLEPKNYTFKVFGLKSDASLITGFVSDPVTANVAVPSCTIGNVGNIVVTSESGKSILTWTTLSWALSYNVYKVSAAGDHILVQNVTEPTYTVHHTQWAIVHDDFVIKALCGPDNVSPDISKVSKVQTGPGLIAILVVLSWIIAMILLRRRSLS